AVLEAADFIIPLLDNYACTPKIEYEGETGAIIDMMQEFDKAENVARLALLGQTANVAALKQVNIEFQALYETRFENRYAFKQGGTTLQRRKALTLELNNFCEAVNGLLLTATDPDEIDGLRAIVATINSTIEQYNIIVNKHLGIVAAKKKNNNKEDGKNDSETQTPDTTNPPAPDTPPQTPDVTPPTIDPDELNPPAVGER
ncbi:MAG: DUF6261 family protein, partial [Tannerellaceae bacterium]|nr:DUF6261 family protein [Tannerellaceae bacterium]